MRDTICILSMVPRLWTDTTQAHRREVKGQILETTRW